MKRLTGKNLLLKLERLRNKRADLILSLTGYLESGANLRYQSKFRDYEEFFTEFFWAYVEKMDSQRNLKAMNITRIIPIFSLQMN